MAASTHDLSPLHKTLSLPRYARHIDPAPHLHVFLGEKPRPVGQDFVELAELLQLLRGFIQAVEPLRIAANLEEIIHVQVHQVGALVSSCRLQDRRERER